MKIVVRRDDPLSFDVVKFVYQNGFDDCFDIIVETESPALLQSLGVDTIPLLVDNEGVVTELAKIKTFNEIVAAIDKVYLGYEH